MYFHENTYDLEILFRQNLHMHTCKYSGCAKSDAIVSDMIREAERCGLETIAFTDHVEPDDAAIVPIMVKDIKEQVAEAKPRLNVLFGAELSAYAVDKYTMMTSDYDPPYRLYSHNHYHCAPPWEHPENKTPEGYKDHSKKSLEFIIRSGRCDCLAHPFVDRFASAYYEGELKGVRKLLTTAWNDNELGDIIELAKQYEVAFELNPSTVVGDPVFAKRLWDLGKEIGAQFNMGTDAHDITRVDTMQLLDEYKQILY